MPSVNIINLMIFIVQAAIIIIFMRSVAILFHVLIKMADVLYFSDLYLVFPSAFVDVLLLMMKFG